MSTTPEVSRTEDAGSTGEEAAGSANEVERPADVEPFVRGAPWPATGGVAYPRAQLTDPRLPGDTRATATVPVGVRLELVGDAGALDIAYRTATDELGWRGKGAGTTFTVWRDGEQVDEQPSELGAGTVRVQLGTGDDRAIVYLPEGMKPVVTGIDAVGGRIEPAPAQPRWIAYGDSIAEGWVASGPAGAWPAIAGRERGFDVVNMGYAGSARGELSTADHIAGLDAEVISLAFGTNCWSMVPFTADLLRATVGVFLRLVRDGHEGVPIVVLSPVVRPDAETTPNRSGATLADLRLALEEATVAFDDPLVTLVRGGELLEPALLADGVHPGDDGHRVLADVVGQAVQDAHALSASGG